MRDGKKDSFMEGGKVFFPQCFSILFHCVSFPLSDCTLYEWAIDNIVYALIWRNNSSFRCRSPFQSTFHIWVKLIFLLPIWKFWQRVKKELATVHIKHFFTTQVDCRIPLNSIFLSHPFTHVSAFENVTRQKNPYPDDLLSSPDCWALNGPTWMAARWRPFCRLCFSLCKVQFNLQKVVFILRNIRHVARLRGWNGIRNFRYSPYFFIRRIFAVSSQVTFFYYLKAFRARRKQLDLISFCCPCSRNHLNYFALPDFVL